MSTIHVLHHGFALCNMRGVPSDWPEGHRWVRLEDADAATCGGCIEVRLGDVPFFVHHTERTLSAPSLAGTAGVEGAWVQVDDYQVIRGTECMIYLTPRAGRCDRGRFLAQLFPKGRLALEIDDADGWPRYYFDEGRAKLEAEAWLKRRGQWVAPTATSESCRGI